MIGVSSFYIKNVELLEYLTQRFSVEIDILPFDMSYYFSNGKYCDLLKSIQETRLKFRINLLQGVLHNIDVSSMKQVSKRLDEIADIADICSARGVTFGSLLWRKMGSRHVLRTLELATQRLNIPVYFEVLVADDQKERVFGDSVHDLCSMRELNVIPLLDTSASGLRSDEIIKFSLEKPSYLHISNHSLKSTIDLASVYNMVFTNGVFLGVSTELNFVDTFDFLRGIR